MQDDYVDYRRDYIEDLLNQAKEQGLFDNTYDLAGFLIENGVTLVSELED